MSAVDNAALAGADGEAAAAPKGGKKKLLIIVAAALLVLGAGGGVGAYMFLGKGEAPAGSEPAEPVADAAPPVFYDMPEIVIRLDGGQGSYLKLATVLDLAPDHTPDEMKAIEPRLLDVMQTYLIELKPEDIRGTAGMYRVRQELLRRVNDLAPGTTKDVLFKTIILQ